MTLRDDALRLGALTVLKDRTEQEIRRLKATVQQQLEDAGVDGAPIRLPNGDKIGKASLTFRGSESLAAALDMRVLTEWVAKNYPTEVQTETHIMGAFLSLLLNRLEDDGEGGCVDPHTGEVVPGVGWATKAGTTYVTTRFDAAKTTQAGGKERMLAAIIARDVDVLELEAGTS